MFKKILSCLLIALMCALPLASCEKDDTPEDMYSATIAGEPFILYVPEGWIDNRDSGISSAYYSLSEAVMASARYYPFDAEQTLEEYIAERIDEYSGSLPAFSLVSKKDSALGKSKATRIEYTFDRVIKSNGTENNVNVTVAQYYTLHGGDVVILSLYCASSAYGKNEDYTTMFEQIRANFVLTSKSDAANELVTDKKTPEGMKIASFDSAEYRLYVPTDWVCNMSDKLSQAYYPESGRPNVSLTSVSPDTDMSVEEYFALAEASYKKDISGYEFVSKETRQVAQRNAVSYTYRATYGDAEYTIMQTVFIYGELMYSFTYTALSESFETHLGDVNKMLDAFRFR